MIMMQAIASGRHEPQQRIVRPMTTSGMPKVSPITTIIQKIRYELTPMKMMHMTKDRGYNRRMVLGFGMRQVVSTRMGHVYSHQILAQIDLLGNVHRFFCNFFGEAIEAISGSETISSSSRMAENCKRMLILRMLAEVGASTGAKDVNVGSTFHSPFLVCSCGFFSSSSSKGGFANVILIR